MIRSARSFSMLVVLLAACGPVGTDPDGWGGSDARADTRVPPVPLPDVVADISGELGPVADAGERPDVFVPPPEDAGVDEGPGGCVSNSECTPSQYCVHPMAGCGIPGLCTERPALCPGVVDPVCGCNGMSYPNDCAAAAAGISIAARGECGGACMPAASCCAADSDCGGRGASCVGPAGTCRGVCKPALTDGTCWRNEDCGSVRSCIDARICECGAACLLPDAPGHCE